MAESIKVAAVTPLVHPGDVKANLEEISALLRIAAGEGAKIIALPQSCLTGATCGDLAEQEFICEAVQDAKAEIARIAAELDVTVAMEDCVHEGFISIIPAADPELVTAHAKRKEALADFSRGRAVIWCNAGYGESTTDFVFAGGSMIWVDGCCVAENPRFQRKSGIIYADVPCEFPQREEYPDEDLAMDDLVDALLEDMPNPHPFVPEDSAELAQRCEEILDIQTTGLMTRLEHICCTNVVLGISGGLDSTLALLVSCRAFDRLGLDRKGIHAVTMPGFGTSSRTKNNAATLMERLGVSAAEISIADSCRKHFEDIGHDITKTDVTYENAQARERTQILMDLANEFGGIVVGTGDLSEMALGWCTYNGDHMSMYGVNAGVPKTMMQAMVRWAAENVFAEARDTLVDIVETPISPELLPGVQPTEDLVGPYELHDFFLFRFVRLGERPRDIREAAVEAFEGKYDEKTIDKWLRKFLWRFIGQQFKRSCSPDGPAVGTVSLSPRCGFRFASDLSAAAWVADLD